MSNITLPTSGSRNWGAGLNHYLDNLRVRMEKIENSINEQNDNNAQLIGFAGSGVVGECTISYDDSTKTITFNGHVYISGVNPSYHQLNKSYGISEQLGEINDNNPKFVFLKKNDSEFVISIKENFTDIDYSYILIGSIIKNVSSFNFQSYYYSSGKTIIQHQYELQHGWADLDSNNCALKLTITNSLPYVSIVNANTGYVIYCGGIGQNNNRLTNTSSIGSTNVIKSIAKRYYFKDETGKTAPTFLGTNNTSLAPSDGQGGYYRLLVDIFGNFIIQKSSITSTLADNSIAFAEQQLLNASFLKINTWQASFPVEILRFGYNKETITNNEYIQGIGTSGFSGFHVVKSIDNGIAPQLRDRIYLQQNNSVWLDSTQFKNNVSQNNNLKFHYEAGHTNVESYSYKFAPNTVVDSKWITVSESEDEPYYVFYYVSSDNVYRLPKNFSISKKSNRTVTVHGWDWEGQVSFDTILENLPLTTETTSYVGLINAGDESISLKVQLSESNFYEFTWEITVRTEYEEASMEEKFVHIFSTYLAGSTPSIEIQEELDFDRVDFDCSTIESGTGIVLWEKTKTPRDIILRANDSYLSLNQDKSQIVSPSITLTSASYQLGLNTSFPGEDAKTTFLRYSDKCFLHLDPNSQVRLQHSSNSWLSLDSNEILIGSNLRVTAGKSIVISKGDLTSTDGNILLIKGNLTAVEGDILLAQGDLTLSQGNILLDNGYLNVSSDIRLKDNINIVKNNFTDIVKNVPIYNFNYKNSKELCIGMIAQELYSILPDKYKDVFVKQYSSSYLPDQLAISETKLIYLLWAAFQEEISKRERLEERVNSLGV